MRFAILHAKRQVLLPGNCSSMIRYNLSIFLGLELFGWKHTQRLYLRIKVHSFLCEKLIFSLCKRKFSQFPKLLEMHGILSASHLRSRLLFAIGGTGFLVEHCSQYLLWEYLNFRNSFLDTVNITIELWCFHVPNLVKHCSQYHLRENLFLILPSLLA